MVNKKISMSLLTICFVLISISGTWASVNSADESDKCIASTGALDLRLNTGSTWQFSSIPLLPGESTTASFTATNLGNRKGYLFITPTITDVPTELASDLVVKIVGTDARGRIVFTVPNAYTTSGVISAGALYPSEVVKISVTCSILKSSTYNGGGSFTIGILCKLNQHNNADNTPHP